MQFGFQPLRLSEAYTTKQALKSAEDTRLNIEHNVKNGNIDRDRIADFNKNYFDNVYSTMPKEKLKNTDAFIRELDRIQISDGLINKWKAEAKKKK